MADTNAPRSVTSVRITDPIIVTGIVALLDKIAALEASLKTCRSEAKAEGIREAAKVCAEPMPQCCEKPLHHGFDEPPECCGEWEPRDKTAQECVAEILAMLPPDLPA